MQIKRIQWDFDAWEDYCQWQQTNKAVLKRINMLIKDIQRRGNREIAIFAPDI